MGFELYYTSAPGGIKRGSSGFCTVAASEAIPRVLWERLESLSAYRHQFAAGSGENPVSAAHWVVNVSGVNYHVLSRIADAGVDHTQRTNAFAHHVVVGPREMAGGGPAWMLRQTGVMAEMWDGKVGTLAARVLPQGGGGETGGVCRAWREATGDAGWGGRLAEAHVGGGMPVCVLFAAGQQMLPLIAEAIALLPAELRWGVTFNTYFTTMPTSATCAWRCCLAGTPAAQSGVRYAGSGGLVIDLTKGTLGPAGGGAFVEYARTGRGRPVAGPGTKPAVGVTRSAPHAPTADETTKPATDEEAEALDAAADPMPPPPRATPRRRTRVQTGVLEAVTGRETAAREAHRRRQVMVLFLGGLAAIAAGMGAAWLAYRQMGPPDLGPVVPVRTPASVAAADSVPAAAPAPTRPPVRIASSPAAAPPLPAPLAAEPDKAPAVVWLRDGLNAPAAGTGMREAEQTWPVPDVTGLTAVRVELAGARDGKVVAKGAAGTMFVEPRGAGEARIRWQDADAPLGTAWTVATVGLAGGKLSVTWDPGFVLTHADAAGTAYWRLRAGRIVALRGDAAAAQYAVAPGNPTGWILAPESVDLHPPAPFGEGASVEAAGLPAGWEQSESGAAGGEAATRPGLAAAQVIMLSKPGEDATATSAFELLFRPGLTEAASTYGQRIAATEADLANTVMDLAAATQAATMPGAAPVDAGKKAALEAQAARYKRALAGYNELRTFAVHVRLPGGEPIATMRFERKVADTMKGP